MSARLAFPGLGEPDQRVRVYCCDEIPGFVQHPDFGVVRRGGAGLCADEYGTGVEAARKKKLLSPIMLATATPV
jgi:hypothetical protein